MNEQAILKCFLAGAAMDDLTEACGRPVEDVIRGELLRIGREASAPHVSVRVSPVNHVPAARPALKAKPQSDPEHEMPKPVLNLTGYPAGLQDPRSTLRRAVWDALAKGPLDMRSLVDALGDQVPGDDPVRTMSNTLWAMTQSGLLRKMGDRPAKWGRGE